MLRWSTKRSAKFSVITLWCSFTKSANLALIQYFGRVQLFSLTTSNTRNSRLPNPHNA